MIPQPPPGQGPIDPRGALSPPPAPPGVQPPFNAPPGGAPYPPGYGTGGPGPYMGPPLGYPPPGPPVGGMPPGAMPPGATPPGGWRPMPFPLFGPPRRNAGRAVFTIVLLIFLALSILLNLILLIVAASGSSSTTQTVITNGSSDQRIAVIAITGIIDEAQAERFKRYMHRAEEDKSIKAIILLVDSPGGTITAADDIYARILR